MQILHNGYIVTEIMNNKEEKVVRVVKKAKLENDIIELDFPSARL